MTSARSRGHPTTWTHGEGDAPVWGHVTSAGGVSSVAAGDVGRVGGGRLRGLGMGGAGGYVVRRRDLAGATSGLQRLAAGARPVPASGLAASMRASSVLPTGGALGAEGSLTRKQAAAEYSARGREATAASIDARRATTAASQRARESSAIAMLG